MCGGASLVSASSLGTAVAAVGVAARCCCRPGPAPRPHARASGKRRAAVRRRGAPPLDKLSGWVEAVRTIGVPGLHFHDLRHTGNMIAADSGAGLKDLMARMGHDDVRAAMIYQHAVRGADKLITEAIDKHLIGHERALDTDDDNPPGVLVPAG
ncbi:tyrosine-type recombinase/integrase [Nonomuraea sp. NPDC052265]|uniref:tyrosine-type recombinase/integrase n=1 Tax=Nonomuraea sp. NPDC052265 TaxID=3364374 RepID=UPI0037CB9299